MDLLRTRLLRGETPVLEVEGEIDFSTADELRTALEAALSANPVADVDMGGVTFFDAAGIRVLLQVAASREGAGPVRLLNVPPAISRVLDIVELGDLPSIDIRDECESRDR